MEETGSRARQKSELKDDGYISHDQKIEGNNEWKINILKHELLELMKKNNLFSISIKKASSSK